MSTNRILLALLLLFGIIQVTGAVKCFECEYFKENSEPKGDAMCRDSFGGESKFEVDCGNTTEFCYKTVGSSDDGKDKFEDYVARGCGDPDYCEKEGVEEEKDEHVEVSRHCCKGELCNSATAALPGLTVLLASILFWLV